MQEIPIVSGGFTGMWAVLTAAYEVAHDEDEVSITLFSHDPYL